MKAYSLTYYWWYRILISILFFCINYFFITLLIGILLHAPVPVFALIIIGLCSVFCLCMAVYYLLYIFTFRLTVSQEGIAAKSIYRRTFLAFHSMAVIDYGIHGTRIVSLYDHTEITISHYLAKSSRIAHELLHTRPLARDIHLSDLYPSVTPRKDYVTFQHVFTTLPFLVPATFFYGFLQTLADIIPPYAALTIYISVLALLFYLLGQALRSPFWPISEDFMFSLSFLLGGIGAWTVLHAMGLLFKYDIQSTWVLLVISIGIGILFYCLPKVRTFLLHRLALLHKRKWAILLGLPLTVFNLLGGVNCLPYGASYTIDRPITEKYSLRGMIPTFSLSVPIWDHTDDVIYTTSTIYEEVAIGDTVSLDIYPGLLGIPWTRASYLGAYIDSLQYSKASTP